MESDGKLNLSGLADKYFKGHGNWQGLGLGQVMMGWLSNLLSQRDHRPNQGEDWAAAGLISTLQHCLARMLDRLSGDQQWDEFEGALNRQTVRMYDLEASCVHLDTTTSSGYRPIEGEGLFQFGHSKDHWPDLPQGRYRKRP